MSALSDALPFDKMRFFRLYTGISELRPSWPLFLWADGRIATDYYAELHEEALQLPEDAGDEDEEVDVNEDYEAESDDEPVWLRQCWPVGRLRSRPFYIAKWFVNELFWAMKLWNL